MKIAIIGAGVSGLVTLRYALENGHECDVLEQTGELGGTWVYSDQCGTDEFGYLIHRTMYKELITLAPKEIMQFLDFSYPNHLERSYISQLEVLQYLQSYALKYNLEKNIKYFNRVVNVTPIDNKWIVTVLDHKAQKEISQKYDAVIVCTGRFIYPIIPEIIGQDKFNGIQIHSRDYRDKTLYANKRVLIIGGSFSAIDIAHQISNVTKMIHLSHRKPVTFALPNVVTVKPGVKQLYECGVLFNDDSKEEYDVIIYCTGYNLNYSFLSKECGITVENNWVRYLYKHIINIEKPSLCFIGIPLFIPTFISSDIQARFALAALESKFPLPSKEEMMEELESSVQKLKSENISLENIHHVGLELEEYYEELAKTAKIRPIPQVMTNISKYCLKNLQNFSYQKQTCMRYVIVDDENYLEIQ